MAGRLRKYPELRDTASMSPVEQAQATLVALRQLHGIGHPIQSNDHSSIDSGRLGIEQLHNLACWEPVRDLHGCEVATIHGWYGDANNGKDTFWFVRWTTDKILGPMLLDQIDKDRWAQHVSRVLRNVIEEIERATDQIDDDIARDAPKHAEAIRSNALQGILIQCFQYMQKHLESTPSSSVGMDRFGDIAKEIDVEGCLRTKKFLRVEYVALQAKKVPRHECFQRISAKVVDRLAKRGHSIPVDIALHAMLKVMPKLDELTLETLDVDDWCITLREHGMTFDGDALSTAMADVSSSRSGASTPRAVRSSNLQTLNHLLQAADRTPRQRGYGAPSELSAVEDDDETASKLSATTQGSKSVAPPSNHSTPTKRLGPTTYPRRPPIVLKAGSSQWLVPEGSQSIRPSGHGFAAGRMMARPETKGSLQGHDTALGSEGVVASIEHEDAATKSAAAENLGEQAVPTQDVDGKASALQSPLGSEETQRSRREQVRAAIIEQKLAQDAEKKDAHADDQDEEDNIKVLHPQGKKRHQPHIWRDHHKEYHSWPRWLTIDQSLHLLIPNNHRKIFLEELFQAESEGRIPYKVQMDDSDREELYDYMINDLETIKEAVEAARKKRFTLIGPACSSNAKTLKQVVDLVEGDAGFDGETDADGDSEMSDE